MSAATAGGSAPPGVGTVGTSSEGPTRVVLIRHGEANCNVEGVVGGHAGCTGLSATGRRQAEALRDRLVATGELAAAGAQYASVLTRAVETAGIAAAGIGDGTASVQDCDLCELHPGEADGLTWDEFRVRYGEPDFDVDPDGVVAPGGESWNSFVSRASNAVTRVARSHRGELVVIVCHAGVIESTLLAFLPVAPGRRRLRLPTEHTSLTEWELAGDDWRLVRYNDAAHLRGLDTTPPTSP
ncbi:MAG TPA: histidine phosphatase family protein [Acidimicrobiales bacterium]|nr:histidine phosphatase family protein [Acidimicrobiales bacterium]